MPELPEVETVCRGLRAGLVGRTIRRTQARRPDLRLPLPARFAEQLAGRRVVGIGRRAKFILVHLDDGAVLIIHLGMSGRLVLGAAAAPGPHDHVVVTLDDGQVLTFRDPRRFGLMALAGEAELEHHDLLRDLGPEPLEDGFDGARLAALMRGRRTPVKAALLNQRRIAGLGNIYACESLFHAGISPRRQAASVVGGRARRLAEAIRAVLEEAIAAGGSSLRDYVHVSGDLGYFQHRFAVYDREGAPCPGCDCAGGIARIVQSGRSTFYCPRRQR